MIDKSAIEQQVEAYLNNKTTEPLNAIETGGSSLDVFLFNTAKRLLITYERTKNGKAGTDDYFRG